MYISLKGKQNKTKQNCYNASPNPWKCCVSKRKREGDWITGGYQLKIVLYIPLNLRLISGDERTAVLQRQWLCPQHVHNPQPSPTRALDLQWGKVIEKEIWLVGEGQDGRMCGQPCPSRSVNRPFIFLRRTPYVVWFEAHLKGNCV